VSFGKWLMKKGAIGGATKLMIKAYRKQKEANPNETLTESLTAITKWRKGIKGSNHLDRRILRVISRSNTLREYLKYFIVNERYPSSEGSEYIIREVVDEICNEEGID